uniref:WH1 domain-containing protein n=1 Tax=Bursaphelenchus xylophilus TaxID=6326 RepID=A0A1I7S2Z1_BURXY
MPIYHQNEGHSFRSDGARFWKTKANFLVIQHGQLIGFNFCVEHLHKVSQLVKHMHGSMPLALSSRFLRVIQNTIHHLHVRPTKKEEKDELAQRIIPRNGQEGVKDSPDPVREPRAFLHRVTLADSDDI